MLHELSSDQDMLRDTTARFLSDRVPLAKLRKDRDDPAGFDPAYWTSGAELGWTMLLVGEDDGGGSVSGNGAADLALIAYEFGKHAAPGPLVDCNVVASALSGQTGALQRAVLQGLLTGLALCLLIYSLAQWVSFTTAIGERQRHALAPRHAHELATCFRQRLAVFAHEVIHVATGQ